MDAHLIDTQAACCVLGLCCRYASAWPAIVLGLCVAVWTRTRLGGLRAFIVLLGLTDDDPDEAA